MSDSTVPLTLPVHPHQLEVQEFVAYDLIVDLRDEPEYAVDHIPGAISAPWRGPASSPAEAPHAPGAEAPGAINIDLPKALDAALSRSQPAPTLLLYCNRGGLDSGALAAELVRRGFAVDVLPGGWGNYRRWVAASIEVLSSVLTFRWVRSPPGGASQVVIDALASSGAQALRTASMVFRQAVPGLRLDIDPPSSQDAIDTRLVDALRRLDPARPVWIDEVLATGPTSLPPALLDALRRSHAVVVEVPLDERVSWLAMHLRARGIDLGSVAGAVDHLERELGRPGSTTSAAERTGDHAALRSLLRDTVDRLHTELTLPSAPDLEHRVELSELTEEAATKVLRPLVASLSPADPAIR
jgi:tRNA 2-selenouridine synthase